MSPNTHASYNVEQTIRHRLERMRNDYSDAANLFDFGRISLVDTSEEHEADQNRQRKAAHHAFLESAANRMGASILIPTLGEPEVLALALDSICRQTLAQRHPLRVEVIVVEDGIQVGQQSVYANERVIDVTERLIRLGVQVIQLRLNQNKGRAIARNVALETASRDIVFFVDNSMVLAPTFLVEHMMRHEKIQQPIALLGVKENLPFDQFRIEEPNIRKGLRVPRLDGDFKLRHKLAEDEAPFKFKGKTYHPGDVVNYMELTSYLGGLGAIDGVGKRTLPTFFQTNIASARREDVLRVGGFDPALKLWGFEDSLLGARLIAIANCKLIPCPSARAFNLETSILPKARKIEDITYNRSMYENFLDAPTDRNYQGLLKSSVASIRNQIETVRGPKNGSTSTQEYSLETAAGIAEQLTASRGMSAITVTRKELIDLIASARAEAIATVINLSGDLSWVTDELSAIRAVKEKRPALRVRIFYDLTRVPRSMISALRELRELGVELRPYPLHAVPEGIRCMLIDPDEPQERRLFWFARGDPPPVGSDRMDHHFVWHQAVPESGLVLDSVRSLVKALDASPRKPVRIGICGVNNVGKTTFVKQLAKCLSDRRLSASTVNDVFRQFPAKVDLHGNYAMLARQLIEEGKKQDCDVEIFDRTSVDNFCYLRLRESAVDDGGALAIIVANSVRAFDLLVDVRWVGENYCHNTRRVTGEQRQVVRGIIDEFFHTHDLKVEIVTFDPNNLSASMPSEVARIADLIYDYASRRWVSDTQ